MAMIMMAVYDTEENERWKYTSETLFSLKHTVDFTKHRLIIIDNNSSEKTKETLRQAKKIMGATIITLSENVGTSRALNFALKQRLPNEVCCKIDNDVVVHESGWMDELEETIKDHPGIGILGLKRSDIWQHPNHENPAYKTHMEGKLEICDDIIGTCTAFSPALLDAIGYSMQPSPFYGGEDVIFSVRSIAAGFQNAFLPHIKITHLDDGANDYAKWKQREAGNYMGEISAICEMIKSGKMSYYYDGE